MALIPALGVMANIVMVLAIFVIGIRSGGISAKATYLALGVSAGWFLLSMIYFRRDQYSQRERDPACCADGIAGARIEAVWFFS